MARIYGLESENVAKKCAVRFRSEESFHSNGELHTGTRIKT